AGPHPAVRQLWSRGEPGDPQFVEETVGERGYRLERPSTERGNHFVSALFGTWFSPPSNASADLSGEGRKANSHIGENRIEVRADVDVGDVLPLERDVLGKGRPTVEGSHLPDIREHRRARGARLGVREVA